MFNKNKFNQIWEYIKETANWQAEKNAEYENAYEYLETKIKELTKNTDIRLENTATQITEIENNYGDTLKEYENKIKQIVNAVNKIWEKQKQIEEREYKIIKVLEKMSEKLDQETIKSVKEINKKAKGEK